MATLEFPVTVGSFRLSPNKTNPKLGSKRLLGGSFRPNTVIKTSSWQMSCCLRAYKVIYLFSKRCRLSLRTHL
jgi:hypothetical protein